MLKKIFGYITVFNINRHRNEYPWEKRPQYKIRWILRWVAPQWLWSRLESVSFYNIYNGTPNEDYEDRSTSLVFEGSNSLYWIYFRDKTGDERYVRNGDWKWCLKFRKTRNDHTTCG